MKNEHEITINKLELASELADKKLADMIEDNIYEYNEVYEESDDEISYTEKGQNEFNEWYDFYINLIETCKN